MTRNTRFIRLCKIWVCVFIPIGLIQIGLSIAYWSPKGILSGMLCTLVSVALLLVLYLKGLLRE